MEKYIRGLKSKFDWIEIFTKVAFVKVQDCFFKGLLFVYHLADVLDIFVVLVVFYICVLLLIFYKLNKIKICFFFLLFLLDFMSSKDVRKPKSEEWFVKF